MSSLRTFLSYISQYSDLSRSNRFRVVFNIPSSLQSYGYASASRKLALQCENAELPGRTFATKDLRTYGPIRRTPTQATYNDLTLTFFCTANPSGGAIGGLVNTLGNFVEGTVAQGIQNIVGGSVGGLLGAAAADTIQNLTGLGGASTGMWERTFFDDWMYIMNPYDQSNFNFEYRNNYWTTLTVTHYDSANNPTTAYQYLEAFPISVEHQTLSWADDAILLMTVTFAYTQWVPGDYDLGGSLLNPIADVIGILGNVGQSISNFISTDSVGPNQTFSFSSLGL